MSRPPAPFHATWVSGFWQLTVADDAPQSSEIIVAPDGHVAIEVVETDAGQDIRFVGPAISPRVVTVRRGTTYLCARLRPGAGLSFLAPPMARFVDKVYALDMHCPEMTARLNAHFLLESLDLATFERALGVELPFWSPPDPIVGTLADRIAAAGGTLDLGEALGSFGMTPRHVRRRFCEAMGLNPKTFAALQRAVGPSAGPQNGVVIPPALRPAA